MINRRGYVKRKIHFWMGLSDLKSEGDWRLASNGLRPSYLNWGTGEPSNHTGEDCARLRIGHDPKIPRSHDWKDTWADLRCNDKTFDHGRYDLHALCEYD